MTRCKTAVKNLPKYIQNCNLKYKVKLQVVRYDNLQNLQIKSSRTTICINCKESCPELQFANLTNKFSKMSIFIMCQRIAQSDNMQGLVKNNSLQKPMPGTVICKQVVWNNNWIICKIKVPHNSHEFAKRNCLE